MPVQETPQGKADSPTYREISTELHKILEDHQLWLTSGEKEGQRAVLTNYSFQGLDLRGWNLKRADFSGSQFQEANLTDTNLQQARLRGANFSGADLSGADFRNADLEGADLTGAKFQENDLTEANLKQARLRGVNFAQADLTRTDFRDADLEEASLADCKGLSDLLLARANLAGCQLPVDQGKFSGLDYVKDASSITSNLFMAMLIACVYTGITVLTTSDVSLLTNTGTTNLPLLGVSINVFSFYLAAPLLLLATYIYFHFNLQHLWESLANLPAVFPDGQQIDQKVYPWLFNWLPSLYFLRLQDHKDRRVFLAHLQKYLATFFGWYFLPITMILIWGRYLYVRDTCVTRYQIVVIAVTILFGLWVGRLAGNTLRGRTSQKPGGVLRSVVLACLALLLMSAISDGFIYGVSDPRIPPPFNRRLVLEAFDCFRLKTVVNFEEKDVSTRFTKERQKGEKVVDKESPMARGAPLKGRDLRYAAAKGAFLARADLRQANLEGAYLRSADLREAKLGESGYPELAVILEKSNLFRANLTNACLYKANLFKASLEGAILTNSDLEFAVLAEANLSAAIFKDAKLKGTIFRAANIQGADFTGAKNLEASQIKEANVWILAHYDGPFLEKLGLPRDHDELLKTLKFAKLNLIKANLREADLSRADFTEAKLQGADLAQADLSGTILKGANLTEAQLRKSKLKFANLQGADLGGASLNDANLLQADFQGATGLQEKQVKSGKNWSLAFYDAEMIRRLNLDQEHNTRVRTLQLSGYDLKGVVLSKAFLVRANFQGADLRQADLSFTELREVNLQGANLSEANLTGAYLGKANLQGANLRGAKVEGALFPGANLAGADLTGALGFSSDQLKEAKTDEQTKSP